jgi:hypothetical protein
MKRWDLVVSSKDKSDKYRNTKVGAVFQKDDGRLSIALDKGVSITGMDGVFITAFVPREKEQGSAPSRGGMGHDTDDDIAF